MDKKRLLELAGVEGQLDEVMNLPDEIKHKAVQLQLQIQKFHGDIIAAKKFVDVPIKLEDAMYAIEHELDKFSNAK